MRTSYVQLTASDSTRPPWPPSCARSSAARRMFRAYGTDVEHVLGDARNATDLGQSFGPISEREIDWLRDKEWARSADDVLWRRSKLGLHTTKPQQEALRTYMAAANAVQELKRVGG